MGCKGDHRGCRGLQRRTARRPDRPTALIVCGGATERRYFDRLCRSLGITSVTTIVEDARHPTGIVERVLAEERRAAQAFDTVWAVLDRDEFLDFDDLVRNGRRRARPARDDSQPGCLGQRVGMAYSNPSFELWLLLHFTQWCRECTATELDVAVRQHRPLANYRHGDDVFDSVDDQRDAAVAKALELERRNAQDRKPEGSNPSTAVHRLVQHLARVAPER